MKVILNSFLILFYFKIIFIGQSIEKHAKDERDKYLQIYARTHERFVAFEKKQLGQMRRLLTILTVDQRKLLTNETPMDSSNPSIIDNSQLNESPKTINNDDDTKLHVARYHKSETDWDELLAQVCSSPMKEKDKCLSFFTMMIVRVPPSSLVSFSFLLLLLHKRKNK